jgi:putative transposase
MDNRLLATRYYGCWVVDFYHEERPHQGLRNALIAPQTASVGRGPVRCRERLGGVLKYYYRAAA